MYYIKKFIVNPISHGGVLKTHSSRRLWLRIFLNSNDSANFLDFSYFVITQLLKKNLSQIGAPSADWRILVNSKISSKN